MLLHECSLNVGSVSQLQKATDLQVVILSDTRNQPVYRPENGELVRRISMALNKC